MNFIGILSNVRLAEVWRTFSSLISRIHGREDGILRASPMQRKDELFIFSGPTLSEVKVRSIVSERDRFELQGILP